MDNENIIEENEIMEEGKEMIVQNDENNTGIMSFDDLKSKNQTQMQMITNIDDKKELYNIDNSTPDAMLNDCEGEKIRVKKVLIKRYEKPMKEPVFDEETGEIIKDKETSMSIVLIDDNGKTYATGSKTFGWQLIRFMCDYKPDLNEGLEIEITKKKMNEGKALGFKLL